MSSLIGSEIPVPSSSSSSSSSSLMIAVADGSTSRKTKPTAKKSRVQAELLMKCEEDKGGGGGGSSGSEDGVDEIRSVAETANLANRKTVASNRDENITIVTNSFFNEFADCMQNLPNRLQVLFTELSTVDEQVKSK